MSLIATVDGPRSCGRSCPIWDCGQISRPTSLEIIATAYVVTLAGEVVKIDDVVGSSHGRSH